MRQAGADVKSVTTPAVKMQEWTPQMLTKIDKDRSSTFRSARMQASNMSVNRVDVQHAVKEVARSMAEPNEGAWIMLKRLVSIPCGSRQARAGDLRTKNTSRLRAWTLTASTPDSAYQEEHDVCSSLPWRQPRELDAWHAKFERC